MQSAYQWTSGG